MSPEPRRRPIHDSEEPAEQRYRQNAAVSPSQNKAKRRSLSKPEVHPPHQRRDHIQDYIPPYLRHYVKPYHGDFCFCPFFHPELIGQLMMEGFLPIAGPDYVLPKLHEQRCVVDLRSNGGGLHISKSAKKKASRFKLTINKSFDEVVAGCHAQHGSTCWLYVPLVDAFRVIYEQSKANASSSFQTKVINEREPPRPCNLRLYSIEVWNVQTGELVGGELGYSVGSIYTSLTGFSAEDSAGSVQLAALGSLLHQQNFTLWDLGMEMEYKKKLGSTLKCRNDFVATVHAVREQHGYMCLTLSNSGEDGMNCKDIIVGPDQK